MFSYDDVIGYDIMFIYDFDGLVVDPLQFTFLFIVTRSSVAFVRVNATIRSMK